MLRIIVKKGNIEKSLKDFKWKFKKTKVKEELNEKKQHKKKSVKRREEINKAKYVRKKNEES